MMSVHNDHRIAEQYRREALASDTSPRASFFATLAADSRIAALYALLDDRLPSLPRVTRPAFHGWPTTSPEDPPTPERPSGGDSDLTDEPEVGAMVVDRDGDVWERTRHGWGCVNRGEGEHHGWNLVREFAPLRLATPDDLTRVGIEDEPAPAEQEGVKGELETCRTCGRTLIVTGTIDCLACFVDPQRDAKDKLAPTDDLPGEPVEPGDLRAGDKVEFTYFGERMTCTLVSHGNVLRSDVPASAGYAPNVVYRIRECWAGGISDVRLIERAPREDEDPDEALAKVIHEVDDSDPYNWPYVTEARRGEYRSMARAARKHITKEGSLAGELDAAVWHRQFEIEKARAEKAEAERDDAIARAESWRDANSGIHAERDAALDEVVRLRVSVEAAEDERDEWKARHEALRADVRREWAKVGDPGPLRGILDRDTARDPSGDHHEVGSKCQRDHCEETPEPDADTVTLRREDVVAVLEHGVLSPTQRADAVRRVRAALGWEQ